MQVEQGGQGERQLLLIITLGTTQIISWGSLYYAFSFLMFPLEEATGAGREMVVGAFSLALFVSGLLSTAVGRLIDLFGGRAVMSAGSLAAGIFLIALSQVQSLFSLYLIWAGLGAAMAATLYDPAFAVLIQAFRTGYRKAITAVALFGGLASTVFWPLTALLIEKTGWENALIVLGLINLLVCVPLHRLVLPARPPRDGVTRNDGSKTLGQALLTKSFYLLSLAFVLNGLVFAAMSVHIMAMLHAQGLSSSSAAWIGAMVGPMQVAGRVVEMMWGKRAGPVAVGLLALAALPLSLLLFRYAGGGVLLLFGFAVLYGASNGVMTIVRGTVPAEFYGRENFGAVNGAMAGPVLIARALGPFIASATWASLGSYDAVLLVLTVLGVVSTGFFYLAFRWRRSGD